MGNYWAKYPLDFCSSSVVCWNGEPSWLAMGLLVIVAAAAIIVLYELFLVIFSR
jgi:hypothetical protein